MRYIILVLTFIMRLHFIAIFLFSFNIIYSKNLDTLDFFKSIDIENVVVTGQIFKTKKNNSIIKTEVIERETIKSISANNLRDLLLFENNMVVNRDNILGSNLSIQGVSGQNVKILIDGFPVIGRLNGNIDLTQINLNNIERIEIVKGPLSVNYGTDALAGTINLITTKEKHNSVSLNSYYETVGNYNLDFGINKQHKKHSFYLEAGRNYFDGWSDSDGFRLIPVSEIADTNRYKQWKPKRQFFGKVQHIIKNKKYEMRTFFDVFNEKITNRGFPNEPYYEYAFDDYYYTYRDNIGNEFKYKKDNKTLNILSSYGRYKRTKNTYYKDLTTLEQSIVPSSYEQDTSKINMLMSKISFSNKTRSVNYQIGIDLNREEATGKRIENQTQNKGNYALFSNIEASLYNNLSFRSGLRLIHNTLYSAPIIPSLNFLYKKNNIKIRTSAAKGFRAPTLKELFFDFVDINHNIVGNTNLKAEKSKNYNINLEANKSLGFKKIKLESSFFYNDIKNLITLAQSPNSDQYSYFNIGKYKTVGNSSSLSLLSDNIKVKIGASYTGRYNDLSESHSVNDFSYSKEINSNVTFKFKKNNSYLNLFFKHNGPIPSFYSVGEEILESRIESYNIFNLSVNKYFFSESLNINLGVKNLFNVKNISMSGPSTTHSSNNSSYSVGYGRSFFMSLNVNLK